MDLLKLPSKVPLSNGMQIIDSDTLNAMVSHINMLTTVVNALTKDVESIKSTLKTVDEHVKSNTKNITMLADAMEEMLKDEDM
jgi:hypothetical protein